MFSAGVFPFGEIFSGLSSGGVIFSKIVFCCRSHLILGDGFLSSLSSFVRRRPYFRDRICSAGLESSHFER